MAKTTYKAAKRALIASKGNISAAARACGISRKGMAWRISKSKTLQQVVEDALESFVDEAETKLGEAVSKGEAYAICFTLKTQGRKRGWVEQRDYEPLPPQKQAVEIILRQPDQPTVVPKIDSDSDRTHNSHP